MSASSHCRRSQAPLESKKSIPSSPPPQASVLIAHGNAGWAAQRRDYIAQPIRGLGGLDVYVLENPGYGPRGGSSSLRSWLSAMEEAVRLLPTNRPIYVVSESIGAGAAAHAAKTYPDRIAGMAMLVPFDSLTSVAQAHMPFLLPNLTLRDRYRKPPPAGSRRQMHPVSPCRAGLLSRGAQDPAQGTRRTADTPPAHHRGHRAQQDHGGDHWVQNPRPAKPPRRCGQHSLCSGF